MSSFLLGRRQRIGVFTLAMACLFACGWLRSQTTKDMLLNSNVDFDGHQLVSYKSSIHWKAYRMDETIGGLKREVIASIPYWSIVIPLTLASAFMLLTGRRQNGTSEPLKVV